MTEHTQNTIQTKKALTVNEASEYTGIGRNNLRKLITWQKIPHFYPHALRHTFATRCFEAGIDAKVVQGFLGHYSIAITLDLYTHVTDDKAKSEMDKLQNLYKEII